MAVVALTNASAGATRNSGTNGDLNALIWWALQQHGGWAREYDDAVNFASVFRANVGNRRRLYIQHNSAVSGGAQRAVVRGCESASSATTLVDPFPTVAQVASTSASWSPSSTANTTDRAFFIYVGDTWLAYFSDVGSGGTFEGGVFGDCAVRDSDDVWATYVSCRNTPGTGITWLNSVASSLSLVGLTGFFCRDASGAVKSTRATLSSPGSALGVITSAPAARGGWKNRVYREPLAIHCSGASGGTAGTLAIIRRGFFPNLWGPLHNGIGSVATADTFTDTAYNASAVFRGIPAAPSGAWIIAEETDTWADPA